VTTNGEHRPRSSSSGKLLCVPIPPSVQELLGEKIPREEAGQKSAGQGNEQEQLVRDGVPIAAH
jgi:hypothetical protein